MWKNRKAEIRGREAEDDLEAETESVSGDTLVCHFTATVKYICSVCAGVCACGWVGVCVEKETEQIREKARGRSGETALFWVDMDIRQPSSMWTPTHTRALVFNLPAKAASPVSVR